MGERLGDGDRRQLVRGAAPERAAAGGEHDPGDLASASTATAGTGGPRSARCRRARVRRRASLAAAAPPGPAAIRLSLLASAEALAGAQRRDRDRQPGEADDAVDDDVGAGSTRSARSATTSMPSGSAAATSARAVRVGDGDDLRAELAAPARSASRPTSRRRAPTPRSGPASARTTSSVCVPIDPVDPAMATRTGRRQLARPRPIRPARTYGPGFEHQRQVVDRGQREQEAVEAVEHAAVALDDRAEVLGVEVALEHALDEVAERRHHRDHDRQQRTGASASSRCRSTRRCRRPPSPRSSSASRRSDPRRVLFGLIHGRSGVRPAAEPTNSAPTSLATTPSASRNSVSVPTFDAPGSDCRSSSRTAGSAPRTSRAGRSR